METISTSSRSSKRPRPPKGRGAGTAGQPPQRTTPPVAHGFLRHQFLPLYAPPAARFPKKKREQALLSSRSPLAALYRCELMGFEDKPFPYNILLAHWDMQRQIQWQHPHTQLSIIFDEDNKTLRWATTEELRVDAFYFIPVIPLYELLQDRKRRREGELLLSVYAYLYREAGVPYYRDSCGALDYHYEMTEEMLDAGYFGDEQGYREYRSELRAAAYYGDVMMRKLFNRCHLRWFKQRLDNFIVSDDFSSDCYHIGKTAYTLRGQFPNREIFDNIEPIDYEDHEVAYLAKLISFVASNEGRLFRDIELYLNDELNECDVVERYKTMQVMDGAVTKIKDLAFERGLLNLLAAVASLL